MYGLIDFLVEVEGLMMICISDKNYGGHCPLSPERSS